MPTPPLLYIQSEQKGLDKQATSQDQTIPLLIQYPIIETDHT